MVSRIVERAKKWHTLNMIEVEMAEEDVRADRLIAVFLLELIPQIANSGSAVENQNLIRVGSNFNARSISTIPHVLFLRCGSGAANSPKPHAHGRSFQELGSINTCLAKLQEAWGFQRGSCIQFL